MTFTGTTPLLLHNARLSDPFDFYAREMKKITSKKSQQTDDDRVEVARLEFSGGLYHNDDLGPYIPSKMLIGALLTSAALTRQRPQFSRSGPTLDALAYRIDYDGPRDIDDLWDNGHSRFVSRESVANQKARVMRTRPVFPDWAIRFIIELDEHELGAEDFAAIAIRSGTKAGLGDWRPSKNGQYGRYSVDILEK